MAPWLRCCPVLVAVTALVTVCATSGEHAVATNPGGCGLQAPEIWKPAAHAMEFVHAGVAIEVPNPTTPRWIGSPEVRAVGWQPPDRSHLSPRAPPALGPLSA